MHATRFRPHIGLRLGEDGPTLGTLQQFADRLDLPPSVIRACLRHHDALVAQMGSGMTQLLVVRDRGIAALVRRAAGSSDSCSP